MGFEKVDNTIPIKKIPVDIIKDYKNTRDIPGINGTSRLSVHLRFGTLSIRELASKAKELSSTYLNELIWRDFYHMILWHFRMYAKDIHFTRKWMPFNGGMMKKNLKHGAKGKQVIHC
jgi:deoxyribodipyrimidine photo-lyase